jgi:hypothetical protein
MAKIYVGGPMRGYKDLNFPAFNKAAQDLTDQMWEVINPVDLNPDPNADYIECMRKDIAALTTCQAIYLLKGWEKSKGATFEFMVARTLELQVIFEV